MVLGAGLTTFSIADYYNVKGYVKKTAVVEAFKDVNWDKQTFTLSDSGTFITDQNGNAHFYPAKIIDGAIEKLNKLLKD